MVVATPFTSSSVSVNHARFVFCRTSGMKFTVVEQIAVRRLREGAWL
jgi:hypothetical protein